MNDVRARWITVVLLAAVGVFGVSRVASQSSAGLTAGIASAARGMASASVREDEQT